MCFTLKIKAKQTYDTKTICTENDSATVLMIE